MNDIGSIIGVGVDLDVHLLGCVEMIGVVDSLRFVLVIVSVVADEVEGEILVRHEWLLRKKGEKEHTGQLSRMGLRVRTVSWVLRQWEISEPGSRVIEG